ncbi:MAG: RagB/SusD family nutrient uptake outer membrane protein, partial [Dysgonomonas sp.]
SGSMSNKLRITLLTLHYSHQSSWNMIQKPWNGFCARPTFISKYETTDVRGPGNEGMGTKNTKQWGWFVGPIYDTEGKNILKDENQNDAIVRPEVESLDAANWGDGARLLKYEVDKEGKYDYCENDFVLVRYADVLYMKEEAILRGGSGVSGVNTADFQKIRKRAFAYDVDGGPSKVYTPATLTLDEILNERGREFAWENIRRRDLIRFGKFSTIQYVEGTESFRKWFPIPYSVIEKSVRDENGNPIWTQNEGYN